MTRTPCTRITWADGSTTEEPHPSATRAQQRYLQLLEWANWVTVRKSVERIDIYDRITT